jgi:hypothetical protein
LEGHSSNTADPVDGQSQVDHLHGGSSRDLGQCNGKGGYSIAKSFLEPAVVADTIATPWHRSMAVWPELGVAMRLSRFADDRNGRHNILSIKWQQLG